MPPGSTLGALRIGLDVRAASHPQSGGFKTYVAQLVQALASIDARNEYRLYVDRPRLGGLRRANAHFTTRVLTSQPGAIGAVLREQLWLPIAGLADRVDVLHFPVGTAPVWFPGPQVITVHDALEHMPPFGRSTSAHPTLKRRLMSAYNRTCQRAAWRRASVVITVSEHSRKDLINLLGIPADRIRVIPSGVGAAFRLSTISTTHERRILAIGSADPRKNLGLLIRAYARLPRPMIAQYRLGLVWTHGALREDVERLANRLGVADRIEALAAPSDGDLAELYRSSDVFVFPSLYEGFGLPPLEAMACGTPVISSNSSSLPEVLGVAAAFFDPTSVEQLVDQLASVLSSESTRSEMAERGRSQAFHYDWESAARLTLSAYEEAVRPKMHSIVKTSVRPSESH